MWTKTSICQRRKIWRVTPAWLRSSGLSSRFIGSLASGTATPRWGRPTPESSGPPCSWRSSNKWNEMNQMAPFQPTTGRAAQKRTTTTIMEILGYTHPKKNTRPLPENSRPYQWDYFGGSLFVVFKTKSQCCHQFISTKSLVRFFDSRPGVEGKFSTKNWYVFFRKTHG